MYDTENVLSFEKFPLFKIPGQPSKPRYSPQFVSNGKFCYQLSFNEVSQLSLLFEGFAFNVIIKKPMSSDESAENISSVFYNKNFPHSVALITNEEKPTYDLNSIQLVDNTKYEVTVQPSHSKRLSKRNKPCLTEEQLNNVRPYSKTYCQFDCLDQTWVENNFSTCHILEFSLKAQNSKPEEYKLCSSLEHDLNVKNAIQSFFDRGVFKFCLKSCLRACERWEYHYTVYSKGVSTDINQTELYVLFNPINAMIFTEEVYTYNWDTLLSNIGGQLGLWMGGSILSVTQLIYFLLLCCVDGKLTKILKINGDGKGCETNVTQMDTIEQKTQTEAEN